jgi:peptide/nickel transport system permease protein
MESVGQSIALGAKPTEWKAEPRFPQLRAFGARFSRDKRAVAASFVVLLVVLMAILAPVLPIQSPSKMHLTSQLEKPSLDHWLGTDSFGRDIFARIVYGARVSILVGAVTVLIALSVGATSGVLAGYFRGPVDSILMRIMDTLLAFPSILLAIALVGILGQGEFNVMLGLGVVYAPGFARIARAKTMAVRSTEYVTAAQAIGSTHGRMLAKHIIPNILGPVIVQATVAYAFAIIAEAGLSFLGLGVPPDVPSWGSMLTEARKFIQGDPWFAIIPGTALSITVLSITLLGDGLRELLDPAAK